ncbi:hypothetical protein O6H91_18G020100 [Diphasiastrum complanatum]|uniref:Uncharacterized protein n=2 Tax=Diphasiastrum complanatum TaxID=34168 RepID=A0ACC2AYN7_DIPCM|nr:hypothetical protein O6H91_18G020100 [Diphasiastrum complanatum]KAJ7522624.1 hypothetical protein O6H91_18G020100 [Diphasiastrum complanatum]
MPPRKLQITVPPFFRCPISLELMKDPVTLCTGLTYDRESIEKWFQEGHSTCPASMQVVESNPELLPNHTLRRLIQEWCVANQSKGVERIPTPKPPAELHQVKALLSEIDQKANKNVAALKRLRSMAKESERNRLCLVEAGAISILSGFLSCFDEAGDKDSLEMVEACEEAIATLALLSLDSAVKKQTVGASQICSIAFILRRGSLEGKVNAALLLHSLAEGEDSFKLIMGEQRDLITGLVGLLREDLYRRAVKASLMALLAIVTPRKNRLRIVEAGAVPVLIELLPEATVRNTEIILAIIEILCNTAEGRAAVTRHALAIPVLVAILRAVSDLATDHAVGILWAISQTAPDKSTMQAAVHEGAFTQLLYVIQADSTAVTKQKSADLLKRLHHFWRDDPCSPDNAAGGRLITHNLPLI